MLQNIKYAFPKVHTQIMIRADIMQVVPTEFLGPYPIMRKSFKFYLSTRITC